MTIEEMEPNRNLTEPNIKIKKMSSVHIRGQLNSPKGYKIVERQEFWSEVTGYIRYLKALKPGGGDWAEGGSHPERDQIE